MKPFPSHGSQRGMALPVMLIILAVMLVTSIYMVRATHSTALTTSNLAYDTTMSRAADYGLHVGFQWLSQTAASNKSALDNSSPPNAYVANIDATRDVHDAAFWTGYQTVTDPDNNQIDYVIHRLCNLPGPYSNTTCMQTSSNGGALGNAVPLGNSLASDAPQFASQPQLHYVISARIHGARGGNVINQMVVLIGT